MPTRVIIHKRQGTAQYYTEDLGGVGLVMVLIPGGTLWMGTPDEEIERLCKEYGEDWFKRERPQHLVAIPSFFMGRFPVTQGQWKAIAQRTDLKVNIDLDPDPSNFKEPYQEYDRWSRPVEQVSWYEAKEFCDRLSKLSNPSSEHSKKEYKLPSEAQWEYACRAIILPSEAKGISQEEWNEKYHQPFHFGETISTDLANYQGTDWDFGDKVYPGNYGRGLKGEYREQTTPVGYFKVANAFGLCDMHGNVWEWCEDDYHSNYESAPDDGSAWIKDNDDNSATKILRGGSWFNDPFNCRSAYRNGSYPDFRDYIYVGFRVVSRTL
jgi:formylglycine-generating enzyme required for sulfatase activity